MDLFSPVLNQMVYLFGFIIIGYVLYKLKAVPENAMTTLSKLESTLFIPCLVLGTFINGFTAEKLRISGTLFLLSTAMLFIMIPVAMLISRLVYRGDEYLQKIATYGLTFANFGYMGNAVMSAVFPDIFAEYQIFVMPLWIGIYTWAVPALLISDGRSATAASEKRRPSPRDIAKRLKPLLNPMFIAMLIGMALGLSGLGRYIPKSVMSIITVSGDCMSPVAMLLTGMTVAASDLRMLLSKPRTYVLSAIRLIAIPLLFVLIFSVLPKGDIFSDTFFACAVCALAMPLGLNTIVVPKGYGKDTTDAAGMALISHTLSIATIPLIFLLLDLLVL